MKNVFKKEIGITLIALIVTIVVLLILAGITIASITGNNAPIDKAGQAKNETEINAEIEELQQVISKAGSKSFIHGNFSGSADESNIKAALTNLVKDSSELNGSAPWIVTGKSGAKYIIDSKGEVYSNTVPAEVTVPQGFVASKASGEDTVEGGLVIYEGTIPVTNANVEEARRTRNQFVWVPVAAEGLTYAKDTTYSNTYGIYQSYYKDYTDWEDNIKTANSASSSLSMAKNEESVAKYGGFYIGRYEAGYPGVVKTVSGTQKIVPLGEGDIVGKKNSSTATVNGATTNLLPQMKKGYAPWELVSQTNAKLASENLYKNSSTVTNARSQLIDSYAWDTTVNWLKKAGIVTEYDSSHHIQSNTYGNYWDSNFSFSNALYVAYPYYVGKTGVDNTWDWANRSYKVGSQNVKYETEKEESKQTDYKQKLIKASLSLGATDNTKTNNIYDLAGNLWEWTTEEGTWDGTTTTRAVRRGGSFRYDGSGYPVVYRVGDDGRRYFLQHWFPRRALFRINCIYERLCQDLLILAFFCMTGISMLYGESPSRRSYRRTLE
ncbi:MAG: hypothetical protein IJH76_06595 [Clostridia bacterium]|nr:hypothetical protein [Clostridia bacterium]